MIRTGGGRPGPGGGEARFPSVLLRFVELFNRREFWESHEILETPWREGGSPFYRGLILYASAFVHLQRNNAHGIVAQLTKAERALSPYAPAYLGVDVRRVLSTARNIRERVEEAREDPPPRWEERVGYPRLRLEDRLLRGDEAELLPSRGDSDGPS